MTINHLQTMLVTTSRAKYPQGERWTPQDWALAIAGEAGELCNVLKKVRRGSIALEDCKADVAEEAADVIIYCNLLLACLGVEAETAILAKAKLVRERVTGFENPVIPPAKEQHHG